MDRTGILAALALIFAVLAIPMALMDRGWKADLDFSGDYYSARSGPGIAVLPLHGVIQNGPSSGIDADDIVSKLEAIRKNPLLRGLILAVDSPGGTPGSTKKVYDAVRRVREEKPVVAAITDLAASGGYYVASAADQIFAYESSLVGSIGVISLHMDVSGLLSRYGVRVETLKAGKFKDSSYPFRSLSFEEKQMFSTTLEDAYRQFLQDVASGRELPLHIVESFAEGRIFSGKQAQNQNMIDRIGGLDDAARALKALLGTKEDLPLIYPERDFFEEFFAGFPALQKNGSSLLFSPLLYLYPATPLPFLLQGEPVRNFEFKGHEN